MSLPTPLDWDRGEPLPPEQIARRVERYMHARPPSVRREMVAEGEWRVVLHPRVFENLVVALTPGGADEPWRQVIREVHADPLSRIDFRDAVRALGLRFETDPALRLDEVRLRREETLR